jgi:hypothetical protein
MTHLFTPRTKNGCRESWALNDTDIAKIGGRNRWTAIVTNQETGRTYKVRGAACEFAHCMCDAVIVREIE